LARRLLDAVQPLRLFPRQLLTGHFQKLGSNTMK
jgi:hypothetical protein